MLNEIKVSKKIRYMKFNRKHLNFFDTSKISKGDSPLSSSRCISKKIQKVYLLNFMYLGWQCKKGLIKT